MFASGPTMYVLSASIWKDEIDFAALRDGSQKEHVCGISKR